MAADARHIGTALVTGAAGAVGSAVCAALAHSGHAIAACDIDAPRLADAVAVLRISGHEAHACPADVGDPAQVHALFARLAARAAAPVVIVHAAGTPGRFAYLAELSDSDWRAMQATHLDGLFFLLRAALPSMRSAGFGRVVAITSLAGSNGSVASGAYAAAKAGQVALVRTAAKEAGPWGISVNAIAPGLVASGVNLALQQRGSSFVAAALAGTPRGVMSAPEDIAALVAFLVSDAAAHINGQVIGHDGGAGLVVASVDAAMRARFEPRVPHADGEQTA